MRRSTCDVMRMCVLVYVRWSESCVGVCSIEWAKSETNRTHPTFFSDSFSFPSSAATNHHLDLQLDNYYYYSHFVSYLTNKSQNHQFYTHSLLDLVEIFLNFWIFAELLRAGWATVEKDMYVCMYVYVCMCVCVCVCVCHYEYYIFLYIVYI